MAEALVSAILGQLTTVAAEEARQQITLLANVEDEVEKIKHNLQAIRVVLEDAEEKEFGNKRLQLWLDRLKEAAFDIEDVLDDWNAALLKLRRRRGRDSSSRSSKVLSCITLHPGQAVWRHGIGSRIRQINCRLDEIAKQKNDYGLAERPERQQSRRRVQTTSFDVDESNLFGRDEIKEDIINCLLSVLYEEGGGGVKTVSIVGMGGVGKTALAQLIYNNKRVEQHFGDDRTWVCVSDFFDVKNVVKAIIEGFEHTTVSGYDDSQLQLLLERLCRSTRGKKFLLVLDDVWEDDMQKWQSLINALKHGAPGSRIILTTRKGTVAQMLNYSRVFPLDKLSDHCCWMILSQLAFHGRDEKECAGLEDIGKKISERCKGLPLAAKTLGNLLRSKSSREEWGNILSSEIWKLDVAEKEIFAPLLLSYYDLPPPVRQCFKFCVTYPKDVFYWQLHQVCKWMAQGYLELDENADLELTGVGYFSFLVSRSFFQDISIYDHVNRFIKCKMHDLVHDFGKFLAKDEIVVKEVDSEESAAINLSSNTRHLTMLIAEEAYPLISINGAEKLHTLITSNSITPESLRAMFKRAKQLRMLDLSFASNSSSTNESIPEEIGSLIHLRYLDLSCNHHRKKLPKSMRRLCNLQYLDLTKNTALEKLPKWIGELSSLRFLQISLCTNVYHFPRSIRRLTNLRELNGIYIKAKGDSSGESLALKDLENMDQLRLLWIRLGGDVIDAEHVKRAKFDNKIHLKDFRICLVDDMDRDYVIQALKLPPHVILRFSETLNFTQVKDV